MRNGGVLSSSRRKEAPLPSWLRTSGPLAIGSMPDRRAVPVGDRSAAEAVDSIDGVCSQKNSAAVPAARHDLLRRDAAYAARPAGPGGDGTATLPPVGAPVGTGPALSPDRTWGRRSASTRRSSAAIAVGAAFAGSPPLFHHRSQVTAPFGWGRRLR